MRDGNLPRGDGENTVLCSGCGAGGAKGGCFLLYVNLVNGTGCRGGFVLGVGWHVVPWRFTTSSRTMCTIQDLVDTFKSAFEQAHMYARTHAVTCPFGVFYFNVVFADSRHSR